MAKVKRSPGPASAVLKQALAGLKAARGKVGWFETAHYPDGTPVALVAAVNEYGWPEHNIPPRLGGRAMSEEKRPEWAADSKVLALAVFEGRTSAGQAMEALVLKAAGDWRKYIAQVTTPPLKVNTVKARLRGRKQGNIVSITIAKPLVHTGVLITELTGIVEKAK